MDLRRLAAPSMVVPAAAAPLRGRWYVLIRASIAVVLLLATLVGLNVGGWRERLLGIRLGGLLGRAAAPRIESLAVLPLENLSRDPEQEYFADGMTEALITELSKIGALRVISRTSVMRYKGANKSLPEIARELNVDAVIEGSVLREGDQVRITVQLIHAPTDQHLWAENYQREMRSILALQSEVSRAIAGEIRIKLTPQEQVRLASRPPINPDAYEAYLKGRYYWSKATEHGVRKGIEYFNHAIEIDPSYAPAYAGLADAYYWLSNLFLPPREAMPKARAAAMKALQIDDTLADAHTSLGLVKTFYDWDWLEAEREFKRAIALNPGYASAHLWYAWNLMVRGRHDEARVEIKRAVELDPLSLFATASMGIAFYFARQYDLAIEHEKKSLEIDPNFFPALWSLGWAYEQKGMYKEAIAELQKAISSGGNPALASLGHSYAASGMRRDADKVLEKLKMLSTQSFVSGYEIAIICVGLGDKEHAFTWLDKAYEDRAEGLTWLKVDPRLDSLRSDPRFQDLLRRMNFPE